MTTKVSDSNEKFLNKNENKKKADKKEEKKDLVPFFQLFRFANKIDILMMLIGTLASITNGCIMPVFMLVFTSIIDSFSSFGSSFCPKSNLNYSAYNMTIPTPNFDLIDQLKTQTYYLLGLGGLTMILNYFQISFWLMPAEKQINKIRKSLYQSILKQDIGWFDVYKSGELTNRLTDDINKIKEGISDKFGTGIGSFATCIAGIVIGLVRGWKLTLVILAISPLLVITGALLTKATGHLSSVELESYAKAGAVAEEVFTAIRTVFAFNGSQKEHKRYESKLDEAKKKGVQKGILNGMMVGFLWFVINSAYALGFWYGYTLTQNLDASGQPEYSVGKILLVFFSIVIGVFSLGNAGPFISTLATARAAAFEVYKIIDRKPTIDISSNQGDKVDNLRGDIEFKDIKFNYPARNEIKILNGVNLSIKSGTSVALVGSSGCGKSTCVQLIQRFYDPLEGEIKIDNKNIKDYNLNWLRSQIGVVNQEPILFATTIAENIRFGRKDATLEEIQEAAKNANAHNFIMELPNKYETLVGDRGSQLSGGQKQRIAIARALIRNPKILLLDEATSALDNESESIVQSALDLARLGRTTIIIAHRLSTIRNADLIYAFDKGKEVEYGTHEQLMAKNGIYANLVLKQQQTSLSDSNENKSSADPAKELKIDLISNKLDLIDEKRKEETKKEDDKNKEVSMLRILALNKPEWYLIVFGCIGSILSGAIQPAFSIVFSKVIAVFSECDKEKQRNDINLYCILFVIFGIITFLSNLTQSSMFSLSGENLTKRLRSLSFKALLKQEIGYFDDQNNNVGKLCTRLAVEAAAVQGATGIRIGVFLMNIGNLGVGLILALAYGWPIALTILAFVPFMILGGVLQTKLLTGFSSKDKEVLEDAGKITSESISNIRTVAIFSKEEYFFNEYKSKIDVPFKAALKSAHIFGFMFGLTNSITFFAMAAAFSLGGHLVQNKIFGITFENVMLVFNCIIFGAQSVGQAATLLPDYSKAQAAAYSILELFDRKTKINNWDIFENGDKIPNQNFTGEINFKQIEFTYPTRPEAKILKELNLNIKKGQSVALVGSSGCGKSTVTQLLERFYDPDGGMITLCDKNISELNLGWLRSQIGIVSQEPILFDLSIKENIAYGDNSREVSLEECIEAAKKANIHDFISNLPEKYNTNVGSKGTQLSGGQKQRIAIARALVRDPKILLLDEATSALDTDSEKIVQDALDKAQMGRTCIIIAHRLSTIRNADKIFVIKNGQVSEAGTHDELIKLNGFYAKLNGQQKS